jgi:nitrate/TMAO reductase-like tetraheme cytochrome c subunit
VTKDTPAEDEAGGPAYSEPAEGAFEASPEAQAPARAPAVRRKPLTSTLVVLAIVAARWLGTGLTTSFSAVCLTCHAESEHALTQAESDPHASMACVRCHDGGSAAALLTTSAPERVVHIVSALLADVPSGTYGYVGSGSCSACHESDIAGTTVNETKAVKMSHREPIEAGATCLDCHRMSDGVVGTTTTKMQPCLRCHDNVAVSAECTYCHTGDIALAVAGRSEPTTATAQALVTDIDCGGCHSQETCDACHGIRLPHTSEFMAYAHAREGVEDLWFNDGRTCGKCHYSGKRECTMCHRGAFLSHGTGFSPRHSIGSGEGCDSCHGAMAYRGRRDFCVDLCHAEE